MRKIMPYTTEAEFKQFMHVSDDKRITAMYDLQNVSPRLCDYAYRLHQAMRLVQPKIDLLRCFESKAMLILLIMKLYY